MHMKFVFFAIFLTIKYVLTSNPLRTTEAASCEDPFQSVQSIYIDPENLCGSCDDDDNDGSITQPFCTLLQGLVEVRPGGKVILREGIHRQVNGDGKHGEIDINAVQKNWFHFNGSSGEEIVIRNYPNENPRFYHSVNIKNWELHAGSIWKVSMTQFVNDWYYTYNIKHDVHNVIIDDDPNNPIVLQEVNTLKSVPSCKTYVASVRTDQTDMIAGDFYYDHDTEILYVWLPDSSAPSAHQMEVAFIRMTRLTNVKKLRISGIDWRYNAGENVQCGWAMVIVGGEDIVFENNVVSYSDAGCLSGGGTDILVKDNVFKWCGNNGAGMKGSGVVYDGNIFEYNNRRHYSCSWHCGGLKLIPNGCDMIFRNNIIQNNFGNGLWLDYMGHNNTIERNYFIDNERHSIFIECTNSADVAGEPTLVRENLIIGSGIRAIYCSASNYTLIYNNLLFDNTQGLTIHGMPRDGQELLNNNAFFNIVLQPRTHNTQMYLGDDAHNNTFNQNVYDKSGRFCISWESTKNFYSGWRREYGYDLDSYLIGEDDFTVSVSRKHYHLVNTAPVQY